MGPPLAALGSAVYWDIAFGFKVLASAGCPGVPGALSIGMGRGLDTISLKKQLGKWWNRPLAAGGTFP